MGEHTFSRTAYTSSVREHTGGRTERVTERAERQAHDTGKLNPLVDPSGFGVIRRSLPRFVQLPNGLWRLTIGTPVPIEKRVDTTGSMGNNVDVALRVMPNDYELSSEVLPGYDLQIATGIFGDVSDRFVICRPQFEMVAEKIVEQLTLMVPERAGGDTPEDPHYGLFGAAYLTDAYLTRIGLKGYDFTVSDAPAREELEERQLRRIFGDEVFQKVVENGHDIYREDQRVHSSRREVKRLPTTREVVQDLLKRAHAFFLQVGNDRYTKNFWTEVFGPERVVVLPSTEMLPQVQAVIIGLTEGTLSLSQVSAFLSKHGVNQTDAARIVRSVANIPIGVQAALPNYSNRPKAGDLFRNKTDLWPIPPEELATLVSPEGDSGAEPAPKGDLDWI